MKGEYRVILIIIISIIIIIFIIIVITIAIAPNILFRLDRSTSKAFTEKFQLIWSRRRYRLLYI